MDSRIQVAKIFTRYTSEQRANHAASHRLGYRQKQRLGDSFWTNNVTNVAYETRKAAIAAAQRYYAEVDAAQQRAA